jgi:hypothetical protein
MTAKVNPDPHAERFTPQPIYNVTAVIDELPDLVYAVTSLRQSGFSDDHISVFMGKDGLAKLDLHGEDHGHRLRGGLHVGARGLTQICLRGFGSLWRQT